MGWMFVDKENTRSNMRDGMREKMRQKMQESGYRMYNGNRENFHESKEYCEGYEQGWEDCLAAMGNQR